MAQYSFLCASSRDKPGECVTRRQQIRICQMLTESDKQRKEILSRTELSNELEGHRAGKSKPSIDSQASFQQNWKSVRVRYKLKRKHPQ